MKPLCIFSEPEDLEQGLFGQTFYYLLQILPYLHEQAVYPLWDVRTLHYGDPPDRLTVPGVLDLAYTPPAGPHRRISLWEMRRRHSHVLGNDWASLHRLWNAYFRTPQRVLSAAEDVLPPGRVLGIHYRGTDKQTNPWDSNPISQGQYLTLIRSFLQERNDFSAIFAATDEHTFVDELRRSFELPVICLGQVEFHMAAEHTTTRKEKADRAMLDCVLFSRCACVLQTSSALPSFAKLLNPALETYRCAASKLFGKVYTDMPYFPVAHIPVLPVTTESSADILRQTMREDWTEHNHMAIYRRPFVASPRWPVNHSIFRSTERLGVDRVVARLVRGHR